MKIADVARALGSEAPTAAGDVTRLVHPSDAAGPADLALALTNEAVAALATTGAGAAVVRAGTPLPESVARIVYRGHERLALAVLTRLFDPGPATAPGIDPRAVIAPDAALAPDVSVGAYTTIGSGTKIGAGTRILAGATIGANVTIGDACTIYPGVRIGDRVAIGNCVIIQPNSVVGSDGFSYVPVRNPDGSRNPIDQPARIHSVGTVVIEDDVEIGADTTIDRATLRQTRIGRGTKIDNQVQIAHNVIIGECCLICGKAALAGSVVLGDRVLVGGAAGIADHAVIGADAVIGAAAAVPGNVQPGERVAGNPAVEYTMMMERYMNVGRLRMLYPRVNSLASRLEALEKGGEGS